MAKKRFHALSNETAYDPAKLLAEHTKPTVIEKPKHVEAVADAPKKDEKTGLPEEAATKNDSLGVYVVTKDPMTYFGKQHDASNWSWRATTKPQRLFDKLQSIDDDASLDDAKKAHKRSEAFKSLTSPVGKVNFIVKLDKSFPKVQPSASKEK